MKELSILGHVVDNLGVCLDDDKVIAWKTPTNKDLLMQFIGSVGYLACGCKGIRIDMQHLSKLAAKTTHWAWTPMDQCTFDLVKVCIQSHQDTGQ